MLTPARFFDLDDFAHQDVFLHDAWVWETLSEISRYLRSYFDAHDAEIRGQVASTATIHGPVSIGEGTIVEDGATIVGPAIIGPNAEIRQGAYIRGDAILGARAVLGHASEIKNSIMLDDAKAPHFAYVGDSILGRNTNLGAGTKLSNLAVSSQKDSSGARPTIHLLIGGERVDTGLAKFGAIIGDDSQTGCNAVTNPGTLIGRNCLVYPNLSVSKGYYPDNAILKLRQEVEIVSRQD